MAPRRTTKAGKLALAAACAAFGLLPLGLHFWIDYRVNQDVRGLREVVAGLEREDAGYAGLRVARSTHPRAWVFGTLDSAGRLDALRERVAGRFGHAEARRMVSQVRLSPATQPGEGK